MKIKEKRTRSIVKAITYRILIIIATALVTWTVTKRWDLTLGITSLTTVINTFLYYVHERFWNTIAWGK